MLQRIVGVLFIVLVGVGTSFMQDEGGLALQELEPGVLFYQSDSLYNVTAEGKEHVRDVSGIADSLGTDWPADMTLSPDGATLVFSKVSVGGGTKTTLYVYNLATGKCCL